MHNQRIIPAMNKIERKMSVVATLIYAAIRV
jgi:hypothetical protein